MQPGHPGALYIPNNTRIDCRFVPFDRLNGYGKCASPR